MLHKKYSAACIGGLLVLAVAQILFDPISSIRHSLDIANVRNRFGTAQSKWVAANIEDYSFEIHGRSQGICAVNALIEVRDNVVVRAQPLNAASPLPPEKWADPDWGNEVFLCDYSHFTVSQMFAMLAKTLQNSPFAILEAEFDPRYGFIAHFQNGMFFSDGWLNMRATTIYNEFRVINFEQAQ